MAVVTIFILPLWKEFLFSFWILLLVLGKWSFSVLSVRRSSNGQPGRALSLARAGEIRMPLNALEAQFHELAIAMTLSSGIKKWPRLAASLTFGFAGCAVRAVWWRPLILGAGAREWALFVGTPALSAGIAGALFGRRAASGSGSANGAALRGAGIALSATAIFVASFSMLYVATQPSTEHWSVLGLVVPLLASTIFAVWWLVAGVGAIAGYLLHRLATSDVDTAR